MDMDKVVVRFLEKRELKKPVMIVGLPGVGSIALLAAEHMISELKAKKFVEVYSEHLPARVFVDGDGIIRMVDNEFYYIKKGGYDLVVLTGDSQAQTQEGQYTMAEKIIEIAKSMGVKRIITLGGYAVARLVEEPRIIGAGTSRKIVKEFRKYGVTFGEGEPGGGIVGASGLLLALGKLKGIEGMCLMGETNGYIPDPFAAKKILQILSNMFSLQMDYSALDEKAKQIESFTEQLKATSHRAKSDDTLRYIG